LLCRQRRGQRRAWDAESSCRPRDVRGLARRNATSFGRCRRRGHRRPLLPLSIFIPCGGKPSLDRGRRLARAPLVFDGGGIRPALLDAGLLSRSGIGRSIGGAILVSGRFIRHPPLGRGETEAPGIFVIASSSAAVHLGDTAVVAAILGIIFRSTPPETRGRRRQSCSTVRQVVPCADGAIFALEWSVSLVSLRSYTFGRQGSSSLLGISRKTLSLLSSPSLPPHDRAPDEERNPNMVP